ncbi:hypothetical protein [Yoonia maricola]|nr:hypothetical protein [Yoonia maricola]
MRRQHCTVPFDALSAEERLVVLHVYALDALPGWMSHYGAIWLSPPHRRLIGQLRDIKSSRPEHPKQYFGAIKHQQQLRSAAKG